MFLLSLSSPDLQVETLCLELCYFVCVSQLSCLSSSAQVVEHLPRMQNIAHLRQLVFFKKIVLGELHCVVLCVCVALGISWSSNVLFYWKVCAH